MNQWNQEPYLDDKLKGVTNQKGWETKFHEKAIKTLAICRSAASFTDAQKRRIHMNLKWHSAVCNIGK